MKKYILQFKGQALLLSDHGGHYIPERNGEKQILCQCHAGNPDGFV